jgi:hypothetical protein
MAISKVEYPAIDAEPVVLYALTNTGSTIAIPVICNTDGTLNIVVA